MFNFRKIKLPVAAALLCFDGHLHVSWLIDSLVLLCCMHLPVCFPPWETRLAQAALPGVRFRSPGAAMHAWRPCCLAGHEANRPLVSREIYPSQQPSKVWSVSKSFNLGSHTTRTGGLGFVTCHAELSKMLTVRARWFGQFLLLPDRSRS